MGTISPLGQRRSSGDPACRSAHYLQNRNKVVLSHGDIVASDLLHQGRNILNDAPIARAVVSNRQIVVDRLRNPNHPQLIALGLR